MNARVLIIVALLLGSVSAYSVSRWIGIGGQSGTKVVLATTKIGPGSEIKYTQVKTYVWPSANIPEGAFPKVKQVVGRVTRQEILPGEAILESKLASADSKAGLEAAITTGKRAITVRVNEVIAVAGFAQPGSYIDVIVNVKESAGTVFSKTVLNRVKVLAVAQETAGDPNKPKVVDAVTLELTPKESEALDLARNVGSLSLVLRNQHDVDSEASEPTKYSDVFSMAPGQPQNSAPSHLEKTLPTKKTSDKQSTPSSRVVRAEKVEVIRGNNVSEVGL